MSDNMDKELLDQHWREEIVPAKSLDIYLAGACEAEEHYQKKIETLERENAALRDVLNDAIANAEHFNEYVSPARLARWKGVLGGVAKHDIPNLIPKDQLTRIFAVAKSAVEDHKKDDCMNCAVGESTYQPSCDTGLATQALTSEDLKLMGVTQ